MSAPTDHAIQFLSRNLFHLSCFDLNLKYIHTDGFQNWTGAALNLPWDRCECFRHLKSSLAGCFRQSPELVNMDLEYFRNWQILGLGLIPQGDVAPSNGKAWILHLSARSDRNSSWEKLEYVEPSGSQKQIKIITSNNKNAFQ